MGGDTGFELRPGGGTLFYVDLIEQTPVLSPARRASWCARTIRTWPIC